MSKNLPLFTVSVVPGPKQQLRRGIRLPRACWHLRVLAEGAVLGRPGRERVAEVAEVVEGRLGCKEGCGLNLNFELI